MRKAAGTLKPDLLPDRVGNYRKKTKRRLPNDSTAYWDLDRKDIRSFKNRNLKNYKSRQPKSEDA